LSVVPLLAVSFALLTRFPALGGLHEAIQSHLLQGLLPAEIARTVLRYLGRFAANANSLTLLGFALVVATALALLLTVENALNRIWQVRKDRPVFKRLGLFVLLLALGPIALGASFWATASVLKASAGWLRTLPPAAAFVVSLWPVLLGALALAACYWFVPNTRVRKRDALAGGFLAAACLELGKRGFAAYLATVPTYRVVYGAFAALPVFLLWVYLSWLVVLAGAVVAANLPRGAKPARRKARA
jgi:membrane protein